MDDFASVAMMRVVREGLRRQGIAAPPLPPARQGRVALPDKRTQLQALWQAHGPAVIARLGEAVHDLHDDPLLTALAPGRDPLDLIERWQRLERFIHSRHRVVRVHAGPGLLRWRHVSLRDGAPPTAAEDLLVAGLLTALATRSGVRGLRARPVGARSWMYDEGWQARRWPAALDAWDWQWQPDPMPDSAAVGAEVSPPPIALLQADPSRGWTLARLAQAVNTAPRTLQRQLARQGHSFSALLAQARLNHAAHALADSSASLAEVGYLGGYADQPHFTRQFHAHTGLTPAQYRAQFARLSRSANRR